MKIGDKVIYVKHTNYDDCIKYTKIQDEDSVERFTRSDKQKFTIGKVYEIVSDGNNNTTKITSDIGKNYDVFTYQIQKVVPNNELSRVLYPNYIESENSDYLIPNIGEEKC